MSPLKIIRLKCLDCCCGSAHEVALCTAAKCPLHAYRFGKRPVVEGKVLSEKQAAAREASRIRFRAMRTQHNACAERSEAINPPAGASA